MESGVVCIPLQTTSLFMGRYFILWILLIACGIGYYCLSAPASGPVIPDTAAVKGIRPATENSYKPTAARRSALKEVIRKHRFNPSLVFLIDMHQPSFKKRFCIYDLARDSILASGLVTHGRCGERWLEGRRYSNEEGSMCTSLGHYKIGKPYYGKFGLAYKLYGLDSTNSKAFERYVVLHSHACVPEAEVDYEICQSDGCPTVSTGFLKKLQSIIDASATPILLSVYDSGQQ